MINSNPICVLIGLIFFRSRRGCKLLKLFVAVRHSFYVQRILCFELIAKANSNWVLRYVKGAIGETDVPDSLPEFISQRRRWLNGSFFAATYAIAHVGQILRSGHSMARKITLMVETVYNIVNLVFAWFTIVSEILSTFMLELI